jgi:hypothetical protein
MSTATLAGDGNGYGNGHARADGDEGGHAAVVNKIDDDDLADDDLADDDGEEFQDDGQDDVLADYRGPAPSPADDADAATDEILDRYDHPPPAGGYESPPWIRRQMR